jgi:hypothetical protein
MRFRQVVVGLVFVALVVLSVWWRVRRAESGRLPAVRMGPFTSYPTDVDAVFTWCNASEPAFAARLAEAIQRYAADPLDLSLQRKYREWGELKYALRGVAQYAPWIRHIYIVTDRQRPLWLEPTHPRVTVVDHRDLFTAAEAQLYLPTFNSHVIESVLHRIPNLSTNFLMFNNDMLLNRPTQLDTFMRPGQPGTYVQYQDKMLKFDCPRGFTSTRVFSDEACFQGALIHDRKVIKTVFEGRLIFWFSHTPHLWHRPTLYGLEARLNTLLSISRSNRLRNDRTDLFWHVMYEAALRELSHASALTIVPVSVADDHTRPGPSEMALHIFDRCDAGGIASFFRALDRSVSKPARVVTIDDGLTRPTVACLVAYRSLLALALDRHWPLRAPWER